MPNCDEEFWTWLGKLDCSNLKLYAMREGEVVFAKEPLIRVEGPLAIAQLLETTLLNLVNYPSLVATNAARMRIAAGNEAKLFEFGLRRAQGPDGGLSASKYAYLGGFDGTSNVLAGKLTGISVKGTHAHAFVMSFKDLSTIKSNYLKPAATSHSGASQVDFVALTLEKRRTLNYTHSNEGELAAFISYAMSFPDNLLALVDTYDTLLSGCLNFIAVGWALHELGYQPVGIRLDSGDLASLSREARKLFKAADATIGSQVFSNCTIAASNDINEQALIELAEAGHEINMFGIGTHLVTCQKQPALGCVYKLVEINDEPRIKLSEEPAKLSIPGRKGVYRLYGADSNPILDVMEMDTAEIHPSTGERILCRDPFIEKKRAYVTPSRVEQLLHLVWDGPNGGMPNPSASSTGYPVISSIPTLQESRSFCVERLALFTSMNSTRISNPTPFKVSVSASLYEFLHTLWFREAPIRELC